MSKRIELGDEVKDTITGFKGIATGRTDWLHGCSRIGIQSQSLIEGKPTEAQWFDEQQCVVVKAAKVVSPTAPRASVAMRVGPGGPRDDRASARKDPSR